MTDRAQILAEIDELAGSPKKLPGDVSVSELKELWNVTAAAVTNRMKRLVDEGVYETLLVFDPERRRSCRVYRKAVPDTEKGE